MYILKLFTNFLLIILTLSPFINSQKPVEDDFHLLSLMERGKLDLDRRKGGLGEAYYKYLNTDVTKSLVMRLGHKSADEMDIYIFDSLDKIERTGDTFTGAVKVCKAENEIECVMDGSGTEQKSQKFYYIFKLRTPGEIYQGSVIAFTEGVEIPLQKGKMFKIRSTYTTNELLFGFDFTKETNPEYILTVINHNVTALSPSITLYEYEGTTPTIIETKSIDSYIKLLNSNKKYRVQVSFKSSKTAIRDIDILIEQNFGSEKKYIAQSMVMGETYSCYGSNLTYFNYYIKMENITALEERALTVSTSRSVFGGLIKGVYSKILELNSSETIDPSKVFPVTEDLSEFKMAIEPNNKQNGHIYYQLKSKMTNKDYYLLVSFTYTSDSSDTPLRIDLASSNQCELVDLSNEIDGEYFFYANRTDGVPVLKKFTFNVTDNTYFVLYFDDYKSSRLYRGNFLEHGDINTFNYSSTMFKLSSKEMGLGLFTISINFFGEGIGQFMKILKTNIPVLFNDTRNDRSFDYDHFNNSVPFYYIASSANSAVTHAHFQEYYGECSVYYKGSLKNQSDPIFSNATEYLVNAKKIKINGKVDIIMVQCHYPAKFNMHFFDADGVYLGNENSKKWVSIDMDKEACIDVKINLDSGAKYSAYSPETSQISIYRKESSGAIGWNVTMSSGSIYFYKDKLVSGEKLCFRGNNIDTVASISVVTENNHKLIEKNETELDNKFLIYYFPQNTEYSEIRFAIRGINTDFFYAFVQQKCQNPTECAKYAPLPSQSNEIGKVEEEYIFADNHQFTFINPYDKKGASNNFRYYLAIELTNIIPSKFTKYNISIETYDRPNYQIIDENVIYQLQEGESTSKYMLEIAELKQIDDYQDKYVVIAHASSSRNVQFLFQKVFYSIYYYKELEKKYEVIYLNNLGVDTQLTGYFATTDPSDYNCIGITYSILKNGQKFDEETVNKYNNMKLSINYTHNGTLLEWNKIEGATNYTVFIAQKNVIGLYLMENDCYLNEIYEQWMNKGEYPKGFSLINKTTENLQYYDASMEEFYVSVIADIEKPLKFRVNYPTITIKDFDPVIPEEIFIQKEPFELTTFNYSYPRVEHFYKIKILDATADTIFKFTSNSDYKDATMYIFDDLYSIMVNETDYYGYKMKVELGYKEEVIFKGNSSLKAEPQKLYVIFKSPRYSLLEITWRFFNERDYIPLDDNDAFYFTQFYSKNELNFIFTSFNNETTEVIYKTQYESAVQKIEIKKQVSGSWKSVYNTTSGNFNYKVNLLDFGVYLITIKNEYTGSTNRLISLRQMSWTVYSMKENDIYKDVLVDSRTLYFSVDMNNWALNEENVITIFEDYHFGSSIKYWGRIINCKESQVMDYMPKNESENELHVITSSTYENYYHLFFKKKIASQITGEKTFLLLTVKFVAEKSFFTPRNLTLSLSERLETLVISNLQPEEEHYDDTDLKNYIPKITKYVLGNNDDSTYVMYVNKTESSTFFINYLIDDNLNINKDYQTTDFYAFSNIKELSKKPNITSFYVLYFSEKTYFHTVTIKTKARAKIITDEKRKLRNLDVEIDNCDVPYLLIGTYKLWSTTAFAYIEQMYGSFSYYYKGTIELTNETVNHILPTDKDQQKEFFYLGKQLDMFKFKCTFPGKLLIHFSDDMEDIDADERNYYYLKEGEELTRMLPHANGVYVEIYNHLNTSITGKFIDYNFTINSTNPRVTYNIAYVFEGATFTAKANKDTVIVINFIDTSNLYRILESSTELSNKYFAIYLPNIKTDYSELRINVSGYQTAFYYLFGRSNSANEPQFLPDAKQGTRVAPGTVKPCTFNITIQNPSIQYNSSKFDHFIAFYMTDYYYTKYNVTIEFVKIPHYETLDTEQIAYLSNYRSIAFNKNVEIDGKETIYYTLITKKCGNFKQSLYINHYEKQFQVFDINNKYSGFTFKNIGVKAHISADNSYDDPEYISGIEFSYTRSNETKQDLIDKIEQFNSKVQLKAYLGDDKKTVTWDTLFLENVDHYILYAMDRTLDIELVENDCYLEHSSKMQAMTGRLPENFYDIKDFSRTDDLKYTINYDRNSYIVIVATLSLGVHIRVNFQTLKADIKHEPIPEEKFKKFYTNLLVLMSLNKKNPEYYIKYDTKSMQTDSILRFSEGIYTEGLNLKIFFYNSTTSIYVDENRTFSGYLSKCELTQEKNECILNGDKSKDNTTQSLYIVIRNYNLTEYESKVSIFNEADMYYLQPYETLLIPTFYSLKTLSFEFSTNKGDIATISLKNQKETNKHTIYLYEIVDGKYVELNKTTDSNFEYTFKEDDAGYFVLKIDSEMEKYTETKKIISLQKTEGELIDLTEGSTFSYGITKTKNMYFKFDISDYEINEENIISAYIPNVYSKDKYLKGIWTKIVSFNTEDPDYEKELVKLAPKKEEDSEFQNIHVIFHPHYYHTHFFKNMGTPYLKNLFLLITVSFELPEDFFDPQPFTIVIGKRSKTIDLTTGKEEPNIEYKDNFYLDEYVPSVVKYLLPKAKEDTSSFALWFSKTNVGTSYKGGLTNNYKYNGKNSFYQIFSICNNPLYSNEKVTEVTVKLFGPKGNMFIKRLLSTHSDILDISGERFDQTRNISITSDRTLTIIGNYLTQTNSWLLPEVLYGTFQYFYKGNFTNDNEEEYLLPVYTDEVTDEVIKLGETYDSLTIKAKRPGKLFVHIFDDVYEANPDGKQRLRLEADKEVTIEIPEGTNVKIEGESKKYGATISFTFGGQTYQFSSTTPLHVELGKVESGKTAKVKTNLNCVVSFNMIVTDKLFTQLNETTITGKTFKHLVFPIPTGETHSDTSITFNNMRYSIYWGVTEYFDKIDYIPLPEKSGYNFNEVEPNSENKTEVMFTNPYDKVTHTTKNYALIVTVEINDENAIEPYDVTVTVNKKTEYDVLEPDTIAVVSTYEGRPFYERLQLQRLDYSLEQYFISAHECGTTFQALQIYNYRELLSSYDISSFLDAILITNPFMDIQVKTNVTATKDNVNAIMFAYYILENNNKETNNKVFEKMEKIKELKLKDDPRRMNFNRYKKTLTWDKTSPCDQYDIYVMKQSIIKRTSAENDCLLFSAQDKFKKSGELVSGFVAIKLVDSNTDNIVINEIKDDESYFIAITAETNPPMPTRLQYSLFSVPIYEPIYPESSFIVLQPMIETTLSLSLHKSEVYYVFESCDTSTDMLIRIKEGLNVENTTINIHVYDQIKKMEKDIYGNFLNADITFNLKPGVSDYIIKASEFKAKKAYIVIINYNMTRYTSEILMFNEKDIKVLKKNNPFEIYYFLSQKKYTFNFTSGNDTMMDISLANELYLNKHTVELYNTTDNKMELIERSTNNSFKYTFKDIIECSYQIIVISSQPAYIMTRKVIQIEKQEGELDDLYENTPLNYNLLVSRPYYLKTIINKYNYGEFGIVTLYLSSDLLGICKGLYGKIVIAEDNETELINMVPKSPEENEFLVETHPDGQHFFLHFKVNKMKEGNKSVILLITVDLEKGFSYFIPKQFTVGLSEKQELIILGDEMEDREYSYPFQVVSHIPKMITFRWMVAGQYSAHIFLSPGEGYCIFYNGTYISSDGKTINDDQNDNLLFALPTGSGAPFRTQNNKAYIQDVDIKLFAPAGTHNIKVVKVLGTVIFKEGVRKENSYQFEINDCTYPAYFIESYEQAMNAWEHVQFDYGTANLYFRGDYISNPSRKDILPTFFDKIYYGFAQLKDVYSNLKIECDTPVRGHIHVFDEVYETPLNSNARYRFFVGNSYYEYQLPSERPLYISAYTPYSVDISVSLDVQGETHTIEKGNPLQIVLDSIKGDNKLTFFAFKDSYFEMSFITDNYLFQEISQGNYTDLTTKNVVGFIPYDTVKKRHTSFEVKLSNIKNDFIYAFMRIDVYNKVFVPLPSKSGYSNNVVKAEYLRFNEFKAFSSGIFDKNQPDIGAYAFVFEIIDNTTNITKYSKTNGEIYPYNLEFIIHDRIDYPEVKKKEFGYISEFNNSFAKNIIEIEDCRDYEEKYVFFTFTLSGNSQENIYLNNFENNMVSIRPENKYSTFFMKNPKLYLQLQCSYYGYDEPEKFSGVGFSYGFVDIIDKEYSSLIDSLKEQKEPLPVTARSSKLSWDTLTEAYEIIYHIYLFEQGKIDKKLLNNEMYVASAKDKNISELKVYDTSNVNHYLISQNGKYDAVVVAEIKGSAPIRYIYNTVEITTGGILGKLWWIILLSVVAISAIAAGIVYFVMQKRKRSVVLPSDYDPLMGSTIQS